MRVKGGLMDFIRRIFSPKEKPIPEQLRPFFEELKLLQNQSLNIIRAEIQDLKHDLKLMESKLQRKDLLDKQQFGQIHYKLHEIPPKKNNQDN